MLTVILLVILGVLAGIGFIQTFRLLKMLESVSDRAGRMLAKFDKVDGALKESAQSERLVNMLIKENEEFRSRQTGAMVGQDNKESSAIEEAYIHLHRALNEIRQEQHSVPALKTAREAMVKYRSQLNEQSNSVRSQLVNPVPLIARGITEILILPLRLFKSAGLIDAKKLHAIESGVVMKMVSGIASISGLLGTAVSIIVQWLEYYQSVFGLLQ